MAIREFHTYDPATGRHERRETPHRARLFGCVPAKVSSVVRWAQDEPFRTALDIVVTRQPRRYARIRTNRAMREDWIYRGVMVARVPSGEVTH